MISGLMLRILGALLFAAAAASARAETIQVKINQLVFAPARISAHVGDSVEWVNSDFIAHTATARNNAWDVMIPPHGTASVVLKATGTVDYYCKFHPNMTGQIVVAK